MLLQDDNDNGARQQQEQQQRDQPLPPWALQDLKTKGFAILDHFLDQDTVQLLRQDIQELRQHNNCFREAKVGEQEFNALNTNVRSAKHCFIARGKHGNVGKYAATRKRVLSCLSAIRQQLGDTIMMEDESLKTDMEPELDELLYVYYPEGGFYRKHVDAADGTPSMLRCFSLILYLNDDKNGQQQWAHQDGGHLRIYLESKSNHDVNKNMESSTNDPSLHDSFMDILPTGGKLVIFRSHLIPHEVLDTRKPRMALVGWFSRAPTDDEFERLCQASDTTTAGNQH